MASGMSSIKVFNHEKLICVPRVAISAKYDNAAVAHILQSCSRAVNFLIPTNGYTMPKKWALIVDFYSEQAARVQRFDFAYFTSINEEPRAYNA